MNFQLVVGIPTLVGTLDDIQNGSSFFNIHPPCHRVSSAWCWSCPPPVALGAGTLKYWQLILVFHVAHALKINLEHNPVIIYYIRIRQIIVWIPGKSPNWRILYFNPFYSKVQTVLQKDDLVFYANSDSFWVWIQWTSSSYFANWDFQAFLIWSGSVSCWTKLWTNKSSKYF